MGKNSLIEWCHHTWSQWRGCCKISPGCALCYAEALSKRNPKTMGVWGLDAHRAINADWQTPLKWDREAQKLGERHRVFPSLCDWLEDRDDLTPILSRFLALIEATPNLDWLLLTKRPENFSRRIRAVENSGGEMSRDIARRWLLGEAPSNVWLGVSVENQEYADERIPILGQTPAAMRWVSYEPALGPVDFLGVPDPDCRDCRGSGETDDPISGKSECICPGLNLREEGGLDWIVVGGESSQGGKKARPFDVEWARTVVAQGKASGVPIFVKQLGAALDPPLIRCPRCTHVDMLEGFDVGGADAGNLFCVQCHHEDEMEHMERLRDSHGGDWDEWPADLRVRELPRGAMV